MPGTSNCNIPRSSFEPALLPTLVKLLLVCCESNLLIASAVIRLDLSQELEYPDAHQQKARDAVDFAALRKEIQEMQEVCNQLRAPVVWSHNDLLSGNVMVPLEVHLIAYVHACIYVMYVHMFDAWFRYILRGHYSVLL